MIINGPASPPKITLLHHTGLNPSEKEQTIVTKKRCYKHSHTGDFFVEFWFNNEAEEEVVKVMIEINNRNATSNLPQIELKSFKSIYFPGKRELLLVVDFSVLTHQNVLEWYELLTVIKHDKYIDLQKISPINSPE